LAGSEKKRNFAPLLRVNGIFQTYIKNKTLIMATKIRLQRNGRKGYAFYSIVIADVRAPRDGKFTEKIGTYNPNTNPATVDLKFDRALYWVEVGAQPTDTVRNILSKEGVYMMKHLRGGVKKGAFDEAAAQAKFEAWKNDKQKGLEAFEAKKAAEKKAAAEARLQAEKKVNEEIAKKVAEKKAAAKAEAEAAQAPADAPAEETTETPAEA
jgi:small subunit ribosomal protein S16